MLLIIETGRSFIDNWYAYEKEISEIEGFLNKNGNPIWFNNPDPVKHKDALLKMDFISLDAMNVILNKSKKRI